MDFLFWGDVGLARVMMHECPEKLQKFLQDTLLFPGGQITILIPIENPWNYIKNIHTSCKPKPLTPKIPRYRSSRHVNCQGLEGPDDDQYKGE